MACIRFMPTLDGKAVYTVEGIAAPDGSLHPVQRAMVEHHGSQCGFCTPGFVMSLWAHYQNTQASGNKPSVAELQIALNGNLCRCTGYRPILAAGLAGFALPKNAENIVINQAKLAEQLDALHEGLDSIHAASQQQFHGSQKPGGADHITAKSSGGDDFIGRHRYWTLGDQAA